MIIDHRITIDEQADDQKANISKAYNLSLVASFISVNFSKVSNSNK